LHQNAFGGRAPPRPAPPYSITVIRGRGGRERGRKELGIGMERKRMLGKDGNEVRRDWNRKGRDSKGREERGK